MNRVSLKMDLNPYTPLGTIVAFTLEPVGHDRGFPLDAAADNDIGRDGVWTSTLMKHKIRQLFSYCCK